MTRQEFVKKWGMQPALSITPAVPMIDVSNQLITDLETLELEALKHLQHYHDTTVGLYVTDVPEKLAKRIYELVKNSKNQSKTILKDTNLKAINYTSNLTNQFSKYVYKKESSTDDITDSTVLNPFVNRYRPFVGINTENRTNLDFATWKRRKKYNSHFSHRIISCY